MPAGDLPCASCGQAAAGGGVHPVLKTAACERCAARVAKQFDVDEVGSDCTACSLAP